MSQFTELLLSLQLYIFLTQWFNCIGVPEEKKNYGYTLTATQITTHPFQNTSGPSYESNTWPPSNGVIEHNKLHWQKYETQCLSINTFRIELDGVQ